MPKISQVRISFETHIKFDRIATQWLAKSRSFLFILCKLMVLNLDLQQFSTSTLAESTRISKKKKIFDLFFSIETNKVSHVLHINGIFQIIRMANIIKS